MPGHSMTFRPPTCLMRHMSLDCEPCCGGGPPQPGDDVDHAERWCDPEEITLELEKKPFSLALIAEFVRRNQEKLLPVSENKDLYIRLCDLDGTTYMGQTHMLKSWQSLYLPRPTKMEVVGVLESTGSMRPFPQWVFLVGEDGCVYVYGDEEIIRVADTLRKLLRSGPDWSGPKYYYPHDISDEDEEVLRQDPEIQKIRQSTDAFINKGAKDFDDFFKFYGL